MMRPHLHNAVQLTIMVSARQEGSGRSRPGEAAGLLLSSDVDLEAGTLSISGSMKRRPAVHHRAAR